MRASTLCCVTMLGILAPARLSAEPTIPPLAVSMYLNADNSLEEHVVGDFNEAASAAAKDAAVLSILAQLDRKGKPFREPGGPKKKMTARYDISDPLVINALSAPLAGPREHRNSASSVELEGFLRWSLSTRPASRTVLIVSSHGNGPRSGQSASPHTSTGPGDLTRSLLYDAIEREDMTVEEFSQAVRASRGTADPSPWDVIALDACLMATLEVAYSLQGATKILIASEMEEPPVGWDHRFWAESFLGAGRDNPGQLLDVDWLSEQFIGSYKHSLAAHGYEVEDYTVVAMRTDFAESVAARVSEFANDVLNAWSSLQVRSATYGARGECGELTTGDFNANTVDLGCFLLAFRGAVESSVLKESAQAVLDALCGASDTPGKCGADGLISRRFIGSDLATTHSGVAIFFPADVAESRRGVTLDAYANPSEGRLAFVRRHGEWVTFLSRYLSDQGEYLSNPGP